MTNRKVDVQAEILQDEREFIYLLLHDQSMVERWLDSDLGMEYFDQEHQEVLQEIVHSYHEGFLLTRKTFKEHFKSLPVPKDRVRAELAFNSCYAAHAEPGDYVGLEKKTWL